MMSKTHITVGIAASLMICNPNTPEDLFAAIIGGTFGGIICDIECRSNSSMRDALYGRLIAVGIVCVLMLTDWIFHVGLVDTILKRPFYLVVFGVITLLVVSFVGRESNHRTFTHSLLYVFLISTGIHFINPKFLIPTLIGGVSHLAIDTFNKKPVPWLYPFFKGGICLKLCYANGIGNSIIMWTGLSLDILLLIRGIMTISGSS